MMCCAVFLVQIVKNMVSMDQKHVLMLVSHLVASQPNLDTLPSGVVKLLCKKQDTGSLLAGIQSKNARTGPFLRCLVQSLSRNLEKDCHRALGPEGPEKHRVDQGVGWHLALRSS